MNVNCCSLGLNSRWEKLLSKLGFHLVGPGVSCQLIWQKTWHFFGIVDWNLGVETYRKEPTHVFKGYRFHSKTNRYIHISYFIIFPAHILNGQQKLYRYRFQMKKLVDRHVCFLRYSPSKPAERSPSPPPSLQATLWASTCVFFFPRKRCFSVGEHVPNKNGTRFQDFHGFAIDFLVTSSELNIYSYIATWFLRFFFLPKSTWKQKHM